MTATATVNLYTRIPTGLNTKLEAEMAATGDKKTDIVRKALEAYLNK